MEREVEKGEGKLHHVGGMDAHGSISTHTKRTNTFRNITHKRTAT